MFALLQIPGQLISAGNGIFDVAHLGAVTNQMIGCAGSLQHIFHGAVHMIAVGEHQSIRIPDHKFCALFFKRDGVFRYGLYLGAAFDPHALFHHAHGQLAADHAALGHHDLRSHFQHGDLSVSGETVVQGGSQEVCQLAANATTYTFTMPAGDVEIRANFVVKMYVEVNDGDGKSDVVPTATNYKYSVVQYVIPAEDLAELWGKGINGLTYFGDFENPTYSTTRTLTVYLLEGENFDLDDGFVPIADARQVFTGQVSLANGQMKIELDEALVYTGRDLLVTLVDSTGAFVPSAWFHGEEGGISRYRCTDDEPYDVTNLPASEYYGFVPRTQIHFEESVYAANAAMKIG